MSDVQIHPTAIIDPGAEIGAGTIVGPLLRNWSRCCAWPKLLAPTSRYTLRTDESRREEQILRLLLYRPANAGPKISRRTHLSGNWRRKHVSRIRDSHTAVRRAKAKRTSAIAGIFSLTAISGTIAPWAMHVIFSNNGTLGGHVQVGDHAVMGGLTAVHQFCRIGRFAITGGCSKIVQDVPPFMIADGNPAEIRGVNLIGLERKKFPPESVKLIKEAFRLIYRSKYNTRQALEAMQKELPQTEEITEIIRFIEQSQRGIVR